MPAPYRRVGRVTRTHGTTGEVSVALRDGLPLPSLVKLGVWLVPPPASGAIERTITSVRGSTDRPIVQISGIDAADTAHEIVGRWLLARETDLPVTPEMKRDAIGYEVVDAQRGVIGEVSGVIVTGANDVYEVTGGPFGLVLVPVIGDVVIRIDHDSRRVEVELLPGLIEDES